jgi:outer membrane protein assembly factor BamB
VNGYASNHGWCVPCAADGRVFFLGSDGTTYALDADTGETLWTAAAEKTRYLRMKDIGKVHWGLTVSGSTVFGMKVARDVATGKELWGVSSPDRRMASPWRVDGIDCFLYATHKGMAALRADTGEPLWTLPGEFGYDMIPTHTDNRLILLANKKGKKGSHLMCCAIDRSGGRLLWESERTYDRGQGSPIIAKNFVFYATRDTGNRSIAASVYDLETGERLQRTKQKTCYWGAVVNDWLFYPGMQWFAIGDKGVTYANKSGGIHGLDLRRAPEIGVCFPPAIADGRFVYRSRNAVYCLDLRAPSTATDETEAVVK